MKLTTLLIEREPSYGAHPNSLTGKIIFTDEASSHSITLSASEVNGILACLAKTVADRAKLCVKQIPEAFSEAAAENLLLERQGEF